MRPTRRGYGVLLVAAAAVLLAWGAGPRSLNAVAGPLVLAVGAGAAQVWRAESPSVERTRPRSGYPGEARTVELSVSGEGVARIAERADDGVSLRPGDGGGGGALDGDEGAALPDGASDGRLIDERTLPADVSYEVTYERRGVHELGPTTITVADVLGLVATTHECRTTTEVVVFPRVYTTGDASAFLRTLGPEHEERTEFDRIREYVPGDSLRDVHWKSSAKHDELLVTEYSDPADEAAVTIAAASDATAVGDPAAADDLATAAATVLVAAVRAGLAVELTLPNGSIDRGYGDSHTRRGLELLARTDGGEVPDEAWASADVRIRADESGATVTVGGEPRPLSDLIVARDNPLVSEGGA